MTPPRARVHPASEAEASAWAEALVRYGMLHAALRTPGGQWLIQPSPHSPVRLLDGPSAVLALAAELQHHAHTREARHR